MNYCTVRRILNGEKGRLGKEGHQWRCEYGDNMAVQGLVKTKNTLLQCSTNKIKKKMRGDVNSNICFSNITVWYTNDCIKGKKIILKRILFYFVFPAKKLVHESKEPTERQNAILSPFWDWGLICKYTHI